MAHADDTGVHPLSVSRVAFVEMYPSGTHGLTLVQFLSVVAVGGAT